MKIKNTRSSGKTLGLGVAPLHSTADTIITSQKAFYCSLPPCDHHIANDIPFVMQCKERISVRADIVNGCVMTQPVSSEISDLCEISDLLLFVSHFASQSNGIKIGDYFFDVCCANSSLLVKCQICGSHLLKKIKTLLGQLRESVGEFGRSAQGTPKLTIKKLRPARFTRLAQFITTELYSLMVSLL